MEDIIWKIQKITNKGIMINLIYRDLTKTPAFIHNSVSPWGKRHVCYTLQCQRLHWQHTEEHMERRGEIEQGTRDPGDKSKIVHINVKLAFFLSLFHVTRYPSWVLLSSLPPPHSLLPPSHFHFPAQSLLFLNPSHHYCALHLVVHIAAQL